MNRQIDIEERFAQLAREVGSRPELAQIVLQQADELFRAQPAPRLLGRVPVGWRWASACAAASLIGVSIWLFWTPRPLSAQILTALARVETVHVTGSTNRIVRKWPLEDPAGARADGTELVPLEAWYWTDGHGVARSYERQGPVTLTRTGGEQREYQKDVDLLYVRQGGYSKDRVQQISRLAEYLEALERPGMIKRNLGTRKEGDSVLAGLELRHRGRVQTVWWNAETFLPVRMSELGTTGEGKTVESHLAFTYNQPVPAQVASYQAPKARQVRYGGSDKASLAWRQHVEEIERRLAEQPLAGRVEVLPRKNGRLFSISWTLATPDGKYVVTPLCGRAEDLSTLADFIRLRVATGGPGRYLASWRVPEELRELTLRHDVVYEATVPWQEWIQVVLGHFGLEYVDVAGTQTVWVARHDEHSHKPTGPVSPPVPYIVEGGIEKRGYVKPGVGMRLAPVTLETLFHDFNERQAMDFDGDSIIIEDQTGLPRPPAFDKEVHGTWEDYWKNVVEPKYPMATDSPYFRGPESLDMARKWYHDQFGIAFTEETRPTTVHVVRRKQP
ncbi:MAG: hypothetical protein WD063_12630 [Pirellulales bacterium]